MYRCLGWVLNLLRGRRSTSVNGRSGRVCTRPGTCHGGGTAEHLRHGRYRADRQFALFVSEKVDDVGLRGILEAQGRLRDFRLVAPLGGLACPARGVECFRVRPEEPGAEGEGAVQIELRNLKGCDGSIKLPEIRPGARDDHGELGLPGSIEALRLVAARQVKRPVGTAQSAFAVGHDRQVCVGSADPPEGPEFAQGLPVVACRVGREANRLADRCEPAASTAGSQGMLESEFRVVFEEPPCHHKVAGNPQCAPLLKIADLRTGHAVKFVALDVIVDLRRPLTVGTVGAAEVAGIVGPGLGRRAVPGAIAACEAAPALTSPGPSGPVIAAALTAVIGPGTAPAFTAPVITGAAGAPVRPLICPLCP